MAKGSGSGGRGSYAQQHALVVNRLVELRKTAPRGEKRTIGSHPTPEQKAAYDDRVRAYNRENRKLSKLAADLLPKANASFSRRRRKD